MTACIACGADAWEPRWEILCRCRSCGFVRAAELPPATTTAEIYTEAYFAGEEYCDYLADREVHRQNFAARWRDMQRLAGKLTSVFEIGCAYGLFLEYATSQGATATGIDVCREAVEHAAAQLGQRATAGDFLTAPIAAGQYQAFCLWDTIEHLPHPEAVIGRVVELLPAGGWLFLTTGDIGSGVARFRGRSWRMIHPPTHLQYFSRDTMRQFLARHGLEVVEIKSIGVYRTLHSVLAGLSVLGKGWSRSVAARLHKSIPVRTQQRLGAWVNLGDIMGVAARKSSPQA
ncbi:MAG TPA: class I SAM-dependent methyltransferase [Pirellulaceae bacterium]|nr:class I SAM-dependent methyltransferase [Pirellulaceae bacterium]